MTLHALDKVLPDPERIRDDVGYRPRPQGDYDTEWARCTEKAKEIYLSLTRRRLEIAELALSVCDVTWGGGGHWSNFEGRKTLKQFAADAGIRYKTLHGYCSIKAKLVDRLPENVFVERDWAAAYRSNMRLQAIKDREPTKAEVARIYREERARCASTSRIHNLIKLLKTTRHHLRVIDWDAVKEEEVEEVSNLFFSIAEQVERMEGKEVEETEDGTAGETVNPEDTISLGPDFDVDLRKLVTTRLMIQASSGGGKSYLIRRFIEQVGRKIPLVIFDPEGEFTSLMIGVVQGAAAVVASVERGESCVIDLSSMAPDDRRSTVKDVCEELINFGITEKPRCIVIMDEAHLFAAQRGKSICRESVIDLASRGRKRGIGLVVSTQRLAKMHKDIAAECLNKMIGRTNLDIDLRRACEELNLKYSDYAASIKKLAPGEFMAYGPAIGDEVYQYTVE